VVALPPLVLFELVPIPVVTLLCELPGPPPELVPVPSVALPLVVAAAVEAPPTEFPTEVAAEVVVTAVPEVFPEVSEVPEFA